MAQKRDRTINTLGTGYLLSLLDLLVCGGRIRLCSCGFNRHM